MENNKDEKKAIEDDIKRYAMLESLERSEAGKMVIVGLKESVMGAINKIQTLYKSAPETELRAWCAILDSRLTLLYAFKNAPKNKTGAVEALNELMKLDEDDNA